MDAYRAYGAKLLAILLLLGGACFGLRFASPGPAYASGDSDARTIPLLMIVVEFDDGDPADVVPYDDGFDWSAALFGEGDSLASFYSDMSGGEFTFVPAAEASYAGDGGNHNAADQPNDGVVHVTLAEPHGAWGLVNEDPAIARVFGSTVLRAFAKSAAFVDYASYDDNGDALLAPDEIAVCICVAGYDASSVIDPARDDLPLIWPHAGMLPLTTSGDDDREVRLQSYIAIPECLWYDADPQQPVEQEPVGVLYHELGHYLGLSDLYALNDDPEGGAWGEYSVGSLSLMDDGGWATVPEGGGYRYSPTAFDAWSRYLLGWDMPLIVTSSGDYRVGSQLSENGYSSLLVPTADPDQYFLVENRQPEGHDEAISSLYAGGNPRGGIVIWHIDKGVYRAFNADNTINDTVHRPAVMEVFFERAPDTDGFSSDWSTSRPDVGEPFYDSVACGDNLGDPLATVSLPLYGDDSEADAPWARVDSGITLQFPTESARDMTVHVELPEGAVASSGASYLPNSAESNGQLSLGSRLGDVACAALMAETGADIALVTEADLRAGLPEGDMTWRDVYDALPSDSLIACYELSGNQLVELLERAVDGSTVDEGLERLAVGGVSCTIDWSAGNPAQLRDVMVGDKDLDPDGYYRVAVTQNAIDACGVLQGLDRNLTLLWGSPADALRSFVLQPDWEEAAAALAGEKTVIGPPAPEQAAGTGTSGVALHPFAIAAIAGIAVLLGFVVTSRSRRRR